MQFNKSLPMSIPYNPPFPADNIMGGGNASPFLPDANQPSGASERPLAFDSAYGQGSQCGDVDRSADGSIVEFHETSITDNTLPSAYNEIVDHDFVTAPGASEAAAALDYGKGHRVTARKDIHDSAPFNDINVAAFGNHPPADASGIVEAIAIGCTQVGGGAGATIGASVDMAMPFVDSVPVPAVVPAYNPAQVSESPGAGPWTSLQPSVPSVQGAGPAIGNTTHPS